MTEQSRRVFRPAPTSGVVRNAVVNFDPSLSRGPVAHGYALAARHLVIQVLHEGHDQDFLVGPICFLYRHAAELGLKHILERGYELMGRAAGVPKHHRLLLLWQEARALILRVDPSAREVSQRIDGVIAELDAIDPDSQTFRYTTRDGQPTWPADLTHIDLQHIGEVMDELTDLLEAGADMLSARLDSVREWHAEMEHIADYDTQEYDEPREY